MSSYSLTSGDRNQAGFALESLCVGGFKSIGDPQTLEIRPLTLLAGANSSGKSSMLQPLLLLKQTLESSFDPGALRLDGPNVSFTSGGQLLSRASSSDLAQAFAVSLSFGDRGSIGLRFEFVPGAGFQIARQRTTIRNSQVALAPGMAPVDLVPSFEQNLGRPLTATEAQWLDENLLIERERCFLRVSALQSVLASLSVPETKLFPNMQRMAESLRAVIHVPGLRGRPQRAYPRTAYDSHFIGVFDPYVATVVLEWQRHQESERLHALNYDLQDLGLASHLEAVAPNDVEVELHVGRLPVGSATAIPSEADQAADRVSVADVGFGVSQTLPVVVALHAARPGQLVYIEQPEIHLHPRAQVAMARVLARAANRGVRVIAETHSSLILRGIQTAVAQGALDPALVALHWFERDGERGATRVSSARLDQDGAFGEWPEDFDDVILSSESAYLDAVELRESQAC